MRRLAVTFYFLILLQEDGREDVDFKKDQRFADIMQDKNVAVSDFAKQRTMTQQRQYLPIFAVRNEVRFQERPEIC